MSRRRARAFAVLLATVAVLVATIATSGGAAATPGPPSHPEFWFDNWKIPTLWADGAKGQGITIAEIDTGVNAALPELAGSILPGTDFGIGGNGHVDREISPFGHGTAMASIMVGQPGTLGVTGIAPSAKILPIAVPLVGTTDASSDDHLAEAIRYAADNGGKIISMSLGGARTQSTDGDEPCPSDEQSAIYYALSKGDVLLAASGNTGQSGSQVEEPGVCLGVISVGAVDQTDTVAAFSSRHSYLTLTAPGVNIPSLGRIAGTVYAGNGTSEATAIASAVVALEWSKFPQLSGEQIVTRLLATLDKRTGSHDDAYGYGVINAFTAVTGSVPADAPNPVYAAAEPFAARAQALLAPTSPPAVAPPPKTSTQIGPFVAGGSPPAIPPGFLQWTIVAVVGLLALLGLLVYGWRRRRSGALAGPEWTPVPTTVGPPSLPVTVPGSEPGAPLRPPDPTGLQWHDITGPPPADEPDED